MASIKYPARLLRHVVKESVFQDDLLLAWYINIHFSCGPILTHCRRILMHRQSDLLHFVYDPPPPPISASRMYLPNKENIFGNLLVEGNLSTCKKSNKREWLERHYEFLKVEFRGRLPPFLATRRTIRKRGLNESSASIKGFTGKE